MEITPSPEHSSFIHEYLLRHHETFKAMVQDHNMRESIVSASESMAETMLSCLAGERHYLHIYGNGGSLEQAKYFRALLEGKSPQTLPLLVWSYDNAVANSAAENDFSFENGWSRQLEGLVAKNDIIMGISTSGASKNVINGLRLAKEKGAKTIALTGINGIVDARSDTDPTKDPSYIDVGIKMPSNETAIIQAGHLAVLYTLDAILKNEQYSTGAAIRKDMKQRHRDRVTTLFQRFAESMQHLAEDIPTATEITKLAGALATMYANNTNTLALANADPIKNRRNIAFFFGDGFLATHLATEELVRFSHDAKRPSYPAIALTGFGNLLPYARKRLDVLVNQINQQVRPGDICIGITATSNDDAINPCLEAAEKKGAISACMMGNFENPYKARYKIRIPLQEHSQLRLAQLVVGHALCALIDRHAQTYGS